jgi:hypothetical protein
MRMRLLFISVCLALIPLVSAAASITRPFSGQGILITRHLNPDAGKQLRLILYREPGVGRIADCSIAEIPRLSSLVAVADGEYPLAVMGKKGNWMLVAYDDAGREGWLEKARWWEYARWEDYLKGRIAHLLPGIKSDRYALHVEPYDTSTRTGDLSDGESLRVVEVRGDWMLAVAVPMGISGWLSWRDGDGRLLISVGEKINLQKH